MSTKESGQVAPDDLTKMFRFFEKEALLQGAVMQAARRVISTSLDESSSYGELLDAIDELRAAVEAKDARS